MSNFSIISQGLLRTNRLSVNHMATQPNYANTLKVLLLGGSNFDLRLKRSFLDTQLVRQYEVVTYEPRGIGQTEHPKGDWTMDDYAADALSVLDAFGWEDAIVMGESFGAMTALHLARSYAHRVSSMVLASGTAGGEGGSSYDISEFLDMPRAMAAKKSLLLQDTRNAELETKNPAAFSQRLAQRITLEESFADPSISSGGYAKLLTARAKHNAWDWLQEINTPTLVVSGEYDNQAPSSAQANMASRMANANFVSFSGGHGLLFSNPDVLTYILEEWLNKTPKLAQKIQSY